VDVNPPDGFNRLRGRSVAAKIESQDEVFVVPHPGISIRPEHHRCSPSAKLSKPAAGAHAIGTDRSNRCAFAPHIARPNDNALDPKAAFLFAAGSATGRLALPHR
jgi:hypothetical protein